MNKVETKSENKFLFKYYIDKYLFIYYSPFQDK